MSRWSAPPVSFLFLGEMLLIPHLYPVVEALAGIAPELPLRLWVSTSVHEELLRRWTAAARVSSAEIRRVPGFRSCPDLKPGDNPALPAKLPMLARMAPALARSRVAVCAEQTSLWLPTILPMKTRFVEIEHGVGGVRYARSQRRRRSAWKVLVPSELEKQAFVDDGLPADRLAVTGYIKSDFDLRTFAVPSFDRPRPIVLYAPHWQRHRSSWWDWGREIVAALAEQTRFNVILAPHQRLVETAPEVERVVGEAAVRPHVHADTRSFAMVDGSYTAAADIYLGDTSSQVVEFLAPPRPCVFLNNRRIDWRATDNHPFWTCGEVIDDLSRLMPALDQAAGEHSGYSAVQRAFAEAALGPAGGAAAERAAEVVLAALRG